MNLLARLRDCGVSFQALPAWVRAWVAGVLVPVNVLPFFFLGTPTGQVAAWAAVFVAATNVPIMLQQRGMSRLMSVPHLVAWFPLVAWLALRLAGTDPLSPAEAALAWALVIVNSLSLVFDVIDSWRWLAGERDIPGFPANPSR
jgi:hypothetical protein